MPITYSIDAERKLITEVWTGEITAACLAEYWQRYLADPEVLAIRCTIVDLRGATILFKGADLLALIQTLVLPSLKGRTWKTAIVVEKPIQYGVSRQYQAFTDHFSRDAIFHDIEEARQWLFGLPD